VIIDCHGHYTTAPAALNRFREAQLAALDAGSSSTAVISVPVITDDEIRESLEGAQLRLQRERGTDLTVFSPRASAMGHHLGDERTSVAWTVPCNDLIRRVCDLYPDNFAPVCQLPQSPGASLEASVRELRRCVEELGFIGCNLNPDPSGGWWTGPPLGDRSWYPLYEAMAELDVPAMIHVSAACNDHFHTTGSHYLGADTTAFMQLMTGPVLRDFPSLRFVIPHGGGAVPYHWGRFRGLAQDMGLPPLEESVLPNVFFDTCVYHQAGIDCLLSVIPVDNILFASEMVGAVRGVDPTTGHHYDDTLRYLRAAPGLSPAELDRICETNVRRVFPRLRVPGD